MHNKIELSLQIHQFLFKRFFGRLFLRDQFLICRFLILGLREQLLLRRFARINRAFLDREIVLKRNEFRFLCGDRIAIAREIGTDRA